MVPASGRPADCHPESAMGLPVVHWVARGCADA
jgi:hypothetical protein